MKHLKILLIALIVSAGFAVQAQYISINTSGTAGSPKAILDLSNNPNLGFLLPNVSLTSPTSSSPITSPADGLLVYNTNSNLAQMPFGVGLYFWSASGNQWYYLNNSGTPPTGVTSVGLTLPSMFNVSGSPVTSSGTFGVTLANQNANTILAGPVSGPAASPTFRSLVTADLPIGIPNANLANSSITVNGAGGITITGSPVSLGGTLTINGPGIAATSIGPATAGGANTGSSGLFYSSNPITGAGTIGLAATGVAAGSYGDASHIPQIIVNAEGMLTGVTNVPLTLGGVSSVDGGTPGAQTGTSGLTFSSNPITSTGTIAIAQAGVTNAMLANSSLSVLPGTGLDISVGSNPVSLGGTITLELTTPVAITSGGTGTSTAPTTNGVIYANSTTTYSSTAAGALDSVLAGNTGGAPTFKSIYGMLNGTFINNQTTTQTNANFYTQSASTGSVGGVIQGANGQTADLLDFDNSSGTPVAYFDAGGDLTTQALTVSSNNYAFLNAGGSGVTNIGNGGTGLVVIGSSSVPVGIGTPSPNSLFNVDGEMSIGQSSAVTGANSGNLTFYNNSNTGGVTIQAPSTSTSYTMTLPVAQGAANNVLMDNAGVLSWGSLSFGADNGISATGSTIQLGGSLVQNTTVNASSSNYTMAFDLGTGSIAGTGTYAVSNGGIGNPYLYVAPSSQGASVGIGNSSPGSNLLNVSTTAAATSGSGNSINITAQGGASGSQGGSVSISGGTGGSNAGGGAVNIASGASTGTANGGNVVIEPSALAGSGTMNGGVAINNTGASPNPYTLLDLESSTSGVLIPSMTTTLMNAIASPAPYLTIYNTTTNCYMFYTGTAWSQISCACAGAPATPPAFTGTNNTNPCGGTTNTYSIASIAGATSYYWIIPAGGGTILSGQGSTSISVLFGNNSTTISVYAVNGCGSSGQLTETINIINSVPGNPALTSGPVSVCAGSGVQSYIVSSTGATSYIWSMTSTNSTTTGISWGGSTTSTNTVNWTSSAAGGTYNVTVYGQNSCGISLSAYTFTVTINPVPPTPSPVSGPTGVCASSGVQSYSASAATATSYVWSMTSTNSTSTGITWGGSTTATNTVDWSGGGASGTYSITVYGVNACGQSLAAYTWTVLVTTGVPGNPGPTSGPASVCANSTVNSYVATATNASSYLWSMTSTNSTSTGITWGGSTTATNTAAWGPTAAAGIYSITVYAQNGCGNSLSSYTWTITVNPLPGTPTPVSGSNSVCLSSTPQSYVATATNATAYVWSMTSTNSTSTGITWGGSSTTTNNVTWTTSAAVGTYSVTVYSQNSCGNSLASYTWTVSVGMAAPSTPTQSPSGGICIGSTYTYSVTAVSGATQYSWSFPTGSVATNPVTTTANTVSVTYTAYPNCGNVACSVSLPCTSLPSAGLAVSVGTACLTTWSTAQTTTWTAPCGVTSITLQMWAAGGGAGYYAGGGAGAYVTGTMTVTAGTTYTVIVGGGGGSGANSNAGGTPGGGGASGTATTYHAGAGGGRTAFQKIAGTDFADAGGGGGGASYSYDYYADGGYGGNPNGFGGVGTITGGSGSGGGGGGGTTTAGGNAGAGFNVNGVAGSSLTGGAGGSSTYSGGGGGGGYFGGGGGGGATSTTRAEGGGGGGSSYTTNLATVTNTAGTNTAGNVPSPPGFVGANYVTGVGVGSEADAFLGSYTAGGPGEMVIQY